jgi:hypothetical protein
MLSLVGDIPYFRCLVRREYTRNLKDGFGEYLEAIAHQVVCRRGHMLAFNVVFTSPEAGGALWHGMPIEALCWKQSQAPKQSDLIAPWNCLSQDFAVSEMRFLARGRVQVMAGGQRHPGRYRFTVDFSGSDLADDPAQHKCLHVCQMDAGHFGAFPNNRILFEDPAFWGVAQGRPDFTESYHEFTGE